MNEILVWKWTGKIPNGSLDSILQYLEAYTRILAWICYRSRPVWGESSAKVHARLRLTIFHDAKNGWFKIACVSSTSGSVEFNRGGEADYTVCLAKTETNGRRNHWIAKVRYSTSASVYNAILALGRVWQSLLFVLPLLLYFHHLRLLDVWKELSLRIVSSLFLFGLFLRSTGN